MARALQDAQAFRAELHRRNGGNGLPRSLAGPRQPGVLNVGPPSIGEARCSKRQQRVRRILKKGDRIAAYARK